MTPLLSDTELLRRLVAFDTTSRNSNVPLADFICDYLDRPGIRIERNPSPDGDKVNLVITVGPDDDGGARGGLVLSGHMDVVPAEEEDWRSDPFTLTEVEGTYVGRGTCDMKGFLALAINAAAALEVSKVSQPMALLLTYDEELGTLGAKHFVDTWPEPDRLPAEAIVGEPTSLKVVRMHKGYLKLRLVLRGKAAHTGYPHLGKNAIEPASHAVVALAGLGRELEAERPAHSEHFPEVPYAPLTVARIAGGVAINVVPDRCVVDFGVRLLPDMVSTDMIRRIETAITAALGEHPYELDVISDSPPMLLPEDAQIYTALCQQVGQQETRSASFATDAGWFQTAGFHCVIFGPGSIEVAHKPNESRPIAEFVKAAELLQDVVRRSCVATN